MKLKLDDEYDFTCLLFGVVSTVPVHTLCWHINRSFNLNLAYASEQQVIRKGRGLGYSFFHFEDGTTMARWFVVANKDGSASLVPELAKFDYIVKIEEHDHVAADSVLAVLRALPPVLACYEFMIDEVKSKENLIFE